MRLSRLLVDPAPSPLGRAMAWDLAIHHGIHRGDHEPGLPPHMNQAIRQAAWAYLRAEEWADHLLLCLLLVQARTGAQEAAEVASRLELESILLTELFGPVCPNRGVPLPYRVLGRT